MPEWIPAPSFDPQSPSRCPPRFVNFRSDSRQGLRYFLPLLHAYCYMQRD